MAHDDALIERAAREEWATYMPASARYISGFFAALGVMLSPFLIYFIVSIVAVAGEIIRYGIVQPPIITYFPIPLDFVVSVFATVSHLIAQSRMDIYMVFYVNMRSFGEYVVTVWPFILGGALLGLPLALFRQRWGFYFRHVRGNQYTYEVQDGAEATGYYRRSWSLPADIHTIVLYLAGPAMMWGMAHYVNPLVYPELLYNMFAVWLTSGVLARLLWEWLQVRLLQWLSRWYGQPRRSLRGEYQLKRMLEDDPALSYFHVWDVAINVSERHACVTSNAQGDKPLRRLKELVSFIDGVQTVEVRNVNGDVHLPSSPIQVVRSHEAHQM